jgi:hypothetical protein
MNCKILNLENFNNTKVIQISNVAVLIIEKKSQNEAGKTY